MKIKNPIKFIRSTLVLLILLYIIGSLFYNKTYAYKEYNFKTIIVSEGETLWNIAEFEKENNEYYKNKDIREIVFEIRENNNLTTSNLVVGQELKI